MMTFKELKKLVKLPLYKEQRVPTVKALEESGVSVVAEKILENHGSISVYQNGYVIYRAHKRVTVFSLRNCVHYKYDALEGAGHHIEEEEFDEYEWYIRLVLEGEDRIFMNYEIIQGKWMPSREDREYKEEILEGVDEAVSTLERMISEERVEELLSTLTDLQRKVVHIHLFHGLSFTEAAKHLAHHMTQARIAETEKYAHVTFFFNGGVEEPNEGEDRILVPSPKEVPTYDLKPEMSAPIVCDKLVEAIESGKYDVIIINFANPDMVGHTGVESAAIKAIETVDACVGRAVEAIKAAGGVLFICADHGNAEVMVDEATGEPWTAHTTNQVPFVLVGADPAYKLREGGRLCDIVPTLIELMGLEKPKEMTGESLLVK